VGLEQIAHVVTVLTNVVYPTKHFASAPDAQSTLCSKTTYPSWSGPDTTWCPDCIRLADALVNTPPRHVANRGSRQP
jgi:hypothetical protein